MGGGPQPPTLRMVAVKAAVYARALRMLSAAAPVECALLAALLVVQGAAPPLGVWLVREVVDAVVAGRGTAALALLVAILPLGFAHTHLQLRSWQTTLQQGSLTRALRYFASVPTAAAHAKEMRLFGLGPHFERRYAETFEALRRETGRARARMAP